MKKRQACTLVALLALLILSVIPTSSSAVDYSTVGVKAGDWAEYSITLTTNIPLVNKVRVNAQAVQGTVVTLNIVSYHSDGETTSDTYNCDISTGLNVAYGYLLAPGLERGDPIYSGADITVNETTTRTAAGTARPVNLVKDTRVLPLDVPRYDRYYDKATGILVEQCGETMMGYMDQTLTATSLWFPSDTLLLMLGSGFAITIAAVILISVLWKRP
nr:hypothetical protein [Candidatus Njordarchaeota archaeon]